MTLRQTPRAMSLVVAPELLGRLRMVSPQRPIPQVLRGKEGKLPHAPFLLGRNSIGEAGHD
ncbi:hypothetical protein [Actinoplanes sp. NPDC023714]|uniref:hypothetical protein n=1 Tax=Actinoplanes sp. NPDC023714 TaxID=3154322 RepID=UPI00340A9B11